MLKIICSQWDSYVIIMVVNRFPKDHKYVCKSAVEVRLKNVYTFINKQTNKICFKQFHNIDCIYCIKPGILQKRFLLLLFCPFYGIMDFYIYILFYERHEI